MKRKLLERGEKKLLFMEEPVSADESNRKFSALFYSVAGTVCDALILYFIFSLSGGPKAPDSVLMTMLSIGLLFPCVAGIMVGLWWEHKKIFIYAWVIYGLLVLAGSIYYIYLLSSIDIWGPLFIFIGLLMVYFPIRQIRQPDSD